MHFLHVVVIGLALICGAGSLAVAQGFDGGSAQFPVADADTPILTIDLDLVFERSQFGQRVLADFEGQRDALRAENAIIVQALREEELQLAEQRAVMDPEVFLLEAEAFDEKAREIRQAQVTKAQSIEEDLAQARADFTAAIEPILGEILIERRASVILFQQAILLSLDRIDITEDAIARVDQSFGEGATPPEN